MKPRILIWILLTIAVIAVIAFKAYDMSPSPTGSSPEAAIPVNDQTDQSDTGEVEDAETVANDTVPTSDTESAPSNESSAQSSEVVDAEIDAALDGFFLDAETGASAAADQDESSEVESVTEVEGANLYE